jgi:hypothetical protein
MNDTFKLPDANETHEFAFFSHFALIHIIEQFSRPCEDFQGGAMGDREITR